MTNKAMPEKLFFDVAPIDVEQPGVWYVASTERGCVTEPTEYVRADLVTGDATEPLENGQYRWFVADYEDVWRVGLVRTAVVDEWECFVFEIEPGDWVEDFSTSKIGPVIRPPEAV